MVTLDRTAKKCYNSVNEKNEVHMEHSNITYKKIAEELNVSQSTVSKALTGSHEISLPLAEKIQQKAKEIGYFSLKRERNREYAKKFRPEIAILIPEIVSIYYSELATRLTDEITEHGGKASLYIIGFDEEKQSRLLDEIYDEVHFDGVILLSAFKYSGEIKLPTVAFDSSKEKRNCQNFSTNIESGMDEAIEHLVSLGHKRIGFVGEGLTKGKEQVFRRAMQKAGIEIDERFIFRLPLRFENIGKEAGERIAEMEERPSAVITAYDEVAIGLISTLTEKSVRVPEDISVIGINDIPVAKYYSPPLTTVSIRTDEKCSFAVSNIFNRIYKNDFGKIERGIELTTHLIVRKSTAKAKE